MTKPKSEITTNEGGNVCHPLSSNADWKAFRTTLIEADKFMGRKPLDGCAFSDVSLGMFFVAKVKTQKVKPRELAISIYNNGLKRCGIPSEMNDCLPDSPARMYALDDIESLIKACSFEATDSQRPSLARQAWNRAYEGAKEALADEGYGDVFND